MMRLFGRGSSAEESPQAVSPPTPLPASSPNMSAGPARPIRLVYSDEKGRFHMDPEAVALLQLVKQPVGVVSVCGRARQGKSFILNQVFREKKLDNSLLVYLVTQGFGCTTEVVLSADEDRLNYCVVARQSTSFASALGFFGYTRF